MKIICFIFARGKSKGIKNKNLLKFKRVSLLGNSIIQAKKISLIKDIFVSTDSKKIRLEALKYGAKVPFLRPKHLAMDNTPELKAWRHAIAYLKKINYKADYIVSLPTTAPLRKQSDILKCIKLATEKKLDFVFTVSPSFRNPYFNMVRLYKNKISKVINKKDIYRRQDAPKCYDMNNACFVFKTKYVLKYDNLLSGKCKIIEMPRSRSIDIDDKFDYNLVKKIVNL